MPLVSIASLDDARLDDYRNVREADLVGRRGRFICEGDVVVSVLLRRGHMRPRSLLVSEKRVPSVTDLLSLVDGETPVYVAPQKVLDGVVGFALHRGLLACADRGELPTAAELLDGLGEGPRVVLLAEAICNHDNMGGLYRNAAAFGADAVLLDERSCDPLYRKAIRVSVGATLFVATARPAPMSALQDALAARGFTMLAMTPDAAATPLPRYALPPSGRVALVLGSEGPGLTAEAFARCDARVRIPMAPGFDSLNVATCAAVTLYHLRFGAS